LEIYKIRNIALFRCAFSGLTQVSIFDPLRLGITCENRKCKQNLGNFAQPFKKGSEAAASLRGAAAPKFRATAPIGSCSFKVEILIKKGWERYRKIRSFLIPYDKNKLNYYLTIIDFIKEQRRMIFGDLILKNSSLKGKNFKVIKTC